jgi:hypothetical protein
MRSISRMLAARGGNQRDQPRRRGAQQTVVSCPTMPCRPPPRSPIKAARPGRGLPPSPCLAENPCSGLMSAGAAGTIGGGDEMALVGIEAIHSCPTRRWSTPPAAMPRRLRSNRTKRRKTAVHSLDALIQRQPIGVPAMISISVPRLIAVRFACTLPGGWSAGFLRALRFGGGEVNGAVGHGGILRLPGVARIITHALRVSNNKLLFHRLSVTSYSICRLQSIIPNNRLNGGTSIGRSGCKRGLPRPGQ